MDSLKDCVISHDGEKFNYNRYVHQSLFNLIDIIADKDNTTYIENVIKDYKIRRY